jgi:GNAT superfamily N-acetyltransferase
VEVLRSGSALPAPRDVEDLYALASGGASTEVSELFATLYDLALDRTDIVAVTAKEVGELIGFGYGHRWRWAEQTDEWSQDLGGRLGDDAALQLEGAFAVQLLAVHPKFTHHGLGFELLKQLMVASAADIHWLHTEDLDSPARRLFRRMGYRPLAHGPEGADGAPGVVLVHG